MADIHITKQAAAQRQIDAAVRILFAEEDPLAVHTVVAAAHTILVDLSSKSEKQSLIDDAYSDALKQVRKHFPDRWAEWDLQGFMAWYRRESRKPANFLKHADRDDAKMLNSATLETDHMLLEACTIYVELGFVPTPEMKAFARWHLATYPYEDQDPIKTADGFIHELDRNSQLRCGAFLLQQSVNLD